MKTFVVESGTELLLKLMEICKCKEFIINEDTYKGSERKNLHYRYKSDGSYLCVEGTDKFGNIKAKIYKTDSEDFIFMGNFDVFDDVVVTGNKMYTKAFNSTLFKYSLYPETLVRKFLDNVIKKKYGNIEELDDGVKLDIECDFDYINSVLCYLYGYDVKVAPVFDEKNCEVYWRYE